jgi:EAL domain-containing protein (putative c-di-GMP-specific phosphodiesterase class I)
MEGYEGIFEFETDKIPTDIMDIKEIARIKEIINNLNLYDGNPEELTKIYTKVLLEDNVSEVLMRISREPIFVKHFPEFYTKNKYGEDVINCQQNSTYHKYGVFKHILATIESVGNSQIPIGDWQKKILKWTMLLHDIGKPYVKVINEDGTESFVGHDEFSVELSVGILNRFYFTDEEKKIILTLIKYHDKFLNEGEIIYENLKLLANELENSKDLFNLLVEVKEADAKSKNVDVYNKYKVTKSKYLEFSNEYFSVMQEQSLTDEKINNEGDNKININLPSQEENKEASVFELNALVENVLNKKNIVNVFQPIIDLNTKTVHGYDVFTRIDCGKKIDIYEFLNYTKDVDKYEKIQQLLLINGIDTFEGISIRESDILFVNIDLTSYDKYINKPRIYDMMKKSKIVVCFNNYYRKDLTEFQKTIDIIHENNGLVALDNFGIGSLETEDLSILNIDYIIPDISITKEILNNEKKQKYISDLVLYTMSRNINLVIVGVEYSDTLHLLEKLGVRYVQGYYFKKPEKFIELINDKIDALLLDKSNDKII